MVNLVKHDLEFILKQIKIAEAHAAGGDLRKLVAEAGGLDPMPPPRRPRPSCFPTACARSTARTTTSSTAARPGAPPTSPSLR